MYKLKFNDPIHIHFIGIGGISMSGLAEILLEKASLFPGPMQKNPILPACSHPKVLRFLWTKC